MKKVMYTICLMVILVAGGCATYWYQPSKTLEQCQQDFLECNYDAAKASYTPHGFGLSPVSAGMQEGFQKANLCMQCMQMRGYRRLSKEQLPAGIRVYQTEGFIYATGQ